MKLNTMIDVLNSIPELIKRASMLVACAMIPGTAGSAPTQTPAQSAKESVLDVGPGRIAWFDITTPNLIASKEFYEKLFGWTFKPVQGTELAVEINTGGSKIGTLRVAEGKISPFNGVVYVQVNDLEASCQKVKQLGATIVPGFPFNLPGGAGAIALALDPGGHPVGLYSKKLLQGMDSP
jgi:predicted enzyme related to lactoylglutathione lyase